MIDMTGRRPLLLIPMLVMIGDLILITISLNLQVYIVFMLFSIPDALMVFLFFQASYSWLVYVSVMAVIIYVVGFAVGLGKGH